MLFGVSVVRLFFWDSVFFLLIILLFLSRCDTEHLNRELDDKVLFSDKYRMAKCCAMGCWNTYHKGYNVVRFPADENLREKWRIAVNRADWIPTYNNRLCEVHFENHLWDGKHLITGAVPTIFCICGCAENISPKVKSQRAKESSQSHQDHTYNYHPTGSSTKVSSKKSTLSSTHYSDHGYSVNSKSTFIHDSQCPMNNVCPSRKQHAEPLAFNTSCPLICSTSSVPPVCQFSQAKESIKKAKSGSAQDKENKELKNQIAKLTKTLDEAKKTKADLEEKLNEEEKWWSGKFGIDQIEAAKTGNSRGRKWSDDTVIKGLQVRFSSGTSGLKCVNKVVFPLPGIRTLQRRTQHIAFLPGVLHEILDAFQEEVKNFDECDRDCLLFFDEMSIKSRIDFDPATKSAIGNISLDGVAGKATKAMVFVLGGVRKKWKITAAYHIVPSIMCNEKLKGVIMELLGKAHKISLNVLGAVCDMGNRGLLASLSFCTQKDHIKNCIPHPIDPSKLFYCIPDMIHLFKSFKEVLSKNESIQLLLDIVQKFSLPSSEVRFSHIRFLADYQEHMEVKFAPTLKAKELESNHFNKMKVSSATNVVNDKVAEGLNFLVYAGEAEEECVTTSWFIALMNSWL